jgi:hypothetical protein
MKRCVECETQIWENPPWPSWHEKGKAKPDALDRPNNDRAMVVGAWGKRGRAVDNMKEERRHAICWYSPFHKGTFSRRRFWLSLRS